MTNKMGKAQGLHGNGIFKNAINLTLQYLNSIWKSNCYLFWEIYSILPHKTKLLVQWGPWFRGSLNAWARVTDDSTMLKPYVPSGLLCCSTLVPTLQNWKCVRLLGSAGKTQKTFSYIWPIFPLKILFYSYWLLDCYQWTGYLVCHLENYRMTW